MPRCIAPQRTRLSQCEVLELKSPQEVPDLGSARVESGSQPKVVPVPDREQRTCELAWSQIDRFATRFPTQLLNRETREIREATRWIQTRTLDGWRAEPRGLC